MVAVNGLALNKLGDKILCLPAWCYERPLHGVRLVDAGRGGVHTGTGNAALEVIFAHTEIAGTEQQRVWSRESVGERYQTRLSLFKSNHTHRLTVDCEGRGSFTFQQNTLTIDWQGGTGPAHYLQTVGLSLWLELHDVICVHANTLAFKDAAIGLIGPSRVGKTTLSSALIEQGFALMSDDMAAIRQRPGWTVYPSWPQLRLWPATGEHILGDEYRKLDRVHHRFGKRILPIDAPKRRFCNGSRALKELWIINPKSEPNTPIELSAVSSSQALLILLQNSMLADAYRPLGLETDRLRRLAGLLEGVTVRRFTYPWGLDQLERVAKYANSVCRELFPSGGNGGGA